LDGQVELRRRLRVLLGERGLLVRRVLVQLALDELDSVVDQVGVEVLDLLLGELDVLEPGDDLVVGEESLFRSVRDELLKLLDFRERDVDGEQVAASGLSWLGGTGLGLPRRTTSRCTNPPAHLKRSRSYTSFRGRSTEISPTTSCREFSTGTVRSASTSSPSLRKNSAAAGAIARHAPSAAFSATPVPSGPAA